MRRRGFTLIEVLAVILVLGILGGVAVVKFVDASGRARQSAEAAVVAAVKSGLHMYRMDGSVRGGVLWPASLDAVAQGGRASGATPFFGHVLQAAVDRGWTKGGTAHTYVSDMGNTFVYDPATGAFGTAEEVAGAAAIAAAAASGGGGGSGGGAGGSSSGPAVYRPSASYADMARWIAGVDALDGYVGKGYAMNGSGEIEMIDSSNQFNEAARRVTLVGQPITGPGTYTVSLDTKLTNYYNQLNYWKIVGVKNGTAVDLSGNTMGWYSTQPGTKSFAQDYAPPEKSNGSWYTYSNTFTISAQDAAQYDQLVVVMAGSRFPGQTLAWRNVSITGP